MMGLNISGALIVCPFARRIKREGNSFKRPVDAFESGLYAREFAEEVTRER